MSQQDSTTGQEGQKDQAMSDTPDFPVDDRAIEMQNNAASLPPRDDDGSGVATPSDPLGLMPPDVSAGPEGIHAVEARDTPPDGMNVQMLEDQPEPEEAELVDPEGRKHDVLIGLTNTKGGLNFHVMTTDEKPDPDNNLAHFFSQFLARAFPWLMEQAAREFTLAQQNAALTERSRIKLVSIDGKPLDGG